VSAISTDPMRQAAPGGSVSTLAELLDVLHCGALLVRADSLVIHLNPRACEMLGRAAGDMLGRRLIDFYPPDADRERLSAALCDAGAHEHETYLPQPDGGRRPVVVSVRPPTAESPLAAYRVVTTIDVTALKGAEEQLREQYRQIASLSDVVLEQALELKNYSKNLEKRVRQRTRELHDANMDAIYMLAVASEAKDQDTGAHVLRIRNYSTALARTIGYNEGEAERVGYSAILHDVGKIQVPDEILKKPGPLTPDERRVMEVHTLAGERILSDRPFFEIARQIARSHQENWNGTGYPDGLRERDIPLPARIVRLADVFDALSSQRIYKDAWPVERVIDVIITGREREFDPELVDAFRVLFDSGEWMRLRNAPPAEDKPR
jgi:PAS domain S-box-containing protein